MGYFIHPATASPAAPAREPRPAPVDNFGETAKNEVPEYFTVNSGRRFYSPELGRWLNRDPIEEEGGRNVYGFLHNRAISWIDAVGEAGCSVSFGTWQEGPDIDDHADGYCDPKLSGLGFRFERADCPAGKLKIVEYAPQCHVTIAFRPGMNPDGPTSGNRDRTLRQHELLHLKYTHLFFSEVTTPVESWVGICVCVECAKAFVSYYDAFRDYRSMVMTYSNAALECTDRPPGRRDKYCKTMQDIAPKLNPAFLKAKAAQEALVETCSKYGGERETR